MRAVVQRVRRAAVSVDGRTTGRIGAGLLVFAGVASDDGPADVDYIAGKLRDLRIFPDEDGRMNRSVVECGGALLVVVGLLQVSGLWTRGVAALQTLIVGWQAPL